MLTVVPITVLLLGVLGLAVMAASVARMIVLERTARRTRHAHRPRSPGASPRRCLSGRPDR